MAYDWRSENPQPVERDEQHDEPESARFEGIGTNEAGYATPDEGPFKCGNCVHYKKINGTHGTCDHPEVVEDAEKGEIPTGREDGMTAATVAYEGCCNFFRPGEHE